MGVYQPLESRASYHSDRGSNLETCRCRVGRANLQLGAQFRVLVGVHFYDPHLAPQLLRHLKARPA